MITPRFQVNQDHSSVTITIRAPFCDLNDLEVVVEDETFIFFCKPYYLRLNLPGRILDNDNRKSSFNADTGEFDLTYPKAIPGEHFKDLDLITKLLCPKVEVTEGSRKIDVVTSEVHSEVLQEGKSVNAEFGFAMRGKYEFEYVNSEFTEIFEVNPYTTLIEERKKERIVKEAQKFNTDHYISDLIDDEEIQNCISLVPPWKNCKSTGVTFTSEELDFLKDLPNIVYNLSPTQIILCHNSLVEILFAYCYDRRTTYFEGTCESGWTISKLCATFCWFDGFTSLRDAIICSFRRTLIYPLYRNFKLSQKVFEDVKFIIGLGQKFIIKCLIEIHNIFLGSDRYILNNLFVKDYIIYVMNWNNEVWLKNVESLNSMLILQKDLGLNLENIERCFSSDIELSDKMQKMNITNVNTTSCSDSDDSSEESSDSGDSPEESSDSSNIS